MIVRIECRLMGEDLYADFKVLAPLKGRDSRLDTAPTQRTAKCALS